MSSLLTAMQPSVQSIGRYGRSPIAVDADPAAERRCADGGASPRRLAKKMSAHCSASIRPALVAALGVVDVRVADAEKAVEAAVGFLSDT